MSPGNPLRSETMYVCNTYIRISAQTLYIYTLPPELSYKSTCPTYFFDPTVLSLNDFTRRT